MFQDCFNLQQSGALAFQRAAQIAVKPASRLQQATPIQELSLSAEEPTACAQIFFTKHSSCDGVFPFVPWPPDEYNVHTLQLSIVTKIGVHTADKKPSEVLKDLYPGTYGNRQRSQE